MFDISNLNICNVKFLWVLLKPATPQLLNGINIPWLFFPFLEAYEITGLKVFTYGK
jgi:hypothetical protein